MNEFKTIYKQVENEIIVKKSKFISHLMPVNSEKEAIDYINSIKTKYWNATHNVYAYVLDENNVHRYSDDGEPQGTSGIPTLQAIKDAGLNNVVAVTTRYFGGTLLGASGLIRAYRSSVEEALKKANIVIKKEAFKAQIMFEYTYLGKIQSELINLGIIISEIKYEENIKVELILQDSEIEIVEKCLMNILSGNVNINIIKRVNVLLDFDNKLLGITEI